MAEELRAHQWTTRSDEGALCGVWLQLAERSGVAKEEDNPEVGQRHRNLFYLSPTLFFTLASLVPSPANPYAELARWRIERRAVAEELRAHQWTTRSDEGALCGVWLQLAERSRAAKEEDNPKVGQRHR
ncbi:sugar ABC transporter substrate-binding protein [Sesbania bispinosa]|nr:sugar ABC transporter substrate-binding protein [Sesbania bispinosa]